MSDAGERPPAAPDARRYAPATLRNREPIRRVLESVLPATGLVLEIASGSGEHACHFARAFPDIAWQPSDADPDCLASIAAWAAEAGLANLRPPMWLDVSAHRWPDLAGVRVDAVVAINLIHIAPWQTCLGLLKGTTAVLRPEGLLYLYGPFMCNGRHTAPSNEAFDASLRRTNAAWGVRDIAHVTAAAREHGFTVANVVDMPANNLSVLFRLEAGSA